MSFSFSCHFFLDLKPFFLKTFYFEFVKKLSHLLKALGKYKVVKVYYFLIFLLYDFKVKMEFYYKRVVILFFKLSFFGQLVLFYFLRISFILFESISLFIKWMNGQEEKNCFIMRDKPFPLSFFSVFIW